MKCQTKHIVIVLMLLLVPIYLISCSGNTTTSLPSDKIAAAPKNPPGVPTNLTARGADSHVDLKWAPPTGENIATSYNLYWSLTSGGVTTASNKILNVSMPFAHMELMNGKTYYYRVSGVNVNGEGPLFIGEVQATPMLPFTKILTKLTDPDAEEYDEFGWSVAIDGDYAIVGAWRSEALVPNDLSTAKGAAYIFHRDAAGAWGQSYFRIVPLDAEGGDRFGYTVAISGEYAIIGAPMKSGGNLLPEAGAAYIYRNTGGNTWEQIKKLAVAEANGMLGYSVSINGDYAIVGQKGLERAYIIYKTPQNNWNNVTTVQIPGPENEPGDNFGISVAICGDYAIVGAYLEDGEAAENLLDDRGAAYIFMRTGVNTWGRESKIMPYDGTALDYFGYRVSLSANYAAVSAYTKDRTRGAVYVFHRVDDGLNFWDEGPKIVAPDAEEGDFFGTSIAISDKYLLVGAQGEDCGWDQNWSEGAAYLYERIGTNTWDRGTKITIPEGDRGDSFGWSVGLSGESAIIGAIGDDTAMENITEAGAVYLY